MSTPKLLIPLAYLNEACFQSLNIDEKKFKMCLKIAQEDLRDILGGEFYEEIESQYSATNDTFTSANATLYEDYLKDYLAWATYHRFFGFSQSESTPTGERSFKDDSSDLLTDMALIAKEKNIKSYVSRYRDKIINYLRQQRSINSSSFPKWVDEWKEEFGWGISCIERDSIKDQLVSITKATRGNE